MEKFSLTGLTKPFDGEIFFGDRVAVLGANGSGKSHFLRLLGGEGVSHTGTCRLGARVQPGLFAQTHAHPEFVGKSLIALLWELHSLQLGPAMSVLRRYELDQQGEQRFESLSGGQAARFQILLLELEGSTLLLLDEPTDNLAHLTASWSLVRTGSSGRAPSQSGKRGSQLARFDPSALARVILLVGPRTGPWLHSFERCLCRTGSRDQVPVLDLKEEVRRAHV